MFHSLLRNTKKLLIMFFALLNKILCNLRIQKPSQNSPTVFETAGNQIEFADDDNGKPLCDGCGLCEKVCPCKDVIQIKDINYDETTSFEYKFDRSQCILCGQCVEFCPQRALRFSGGSEICAINKNELITGFTGK